MGYSTGVILEFRGENLFLSNLYTAPMVWRGYEFNSAEQAFAYAKTFFTSSEGVGNHHRDLIMKSKTSSEAKSLGHKTPINADEWDKHKVMYMREIVHAKFLTVDGLAGRLMNTGAKMLIEGNDHGDKFWGRVHEGGRWRGLNVLGVILMEERGFWNQPR